MSAADSRTQTAAEELANSLTHGLGLVLSAGGMVLLIVLAALKRDAWAIASCSLYGATLILLYTASTLYHATRRPGVKRVMRVIDHSSIFLLIAGTYTPYMLGPLRGPWGWSLFGVVWGLALAGILMKLFTFQKTRMLSIIIALAMGWMSLLALRPMLRAMSPAGVWWLVGGGALYSLGAVFYVWKRLPFGHAVWHLFVLAGSLAHFFGILFHVV